MYNLLKSFENQKPFTKTIAGGGEQVLDSVSVRVGLELKILSSASRMLTFRAFLKVDDKSLSFGDEKEEERKERKLYNKLRARS